MLMTHRPTQPHLGRGNCVCREGRVPSRLPTPGGPEGAHSQRHNFLSCQPGSRPRRVTELSVCHHTVIWVKVNKFLFRAATSPQD